MAATVGKYAAKKMLAGQLKKYEDKAPAGQFDPYYEYIPNPRKPGKMKKVKKQIPSYIPEHDANILAKVRRRAYRLDMCLFSFMGVRFGWSSVIGLIPAAGDALDAFMALMLVMTCRKVDGGLDSGMQMQMVMYVLMDFVVGIVPFVGDLLDAYIKCNSMNCRLLEKHLDKKYKPKELVQREKEEKRRSMAAGQPYHPPAPATVYEDMDDDEILPVYNTAAGANTGNGVAEPSRPTPAVQREETRGGPSAAKEKKGGWFSRGNSKTGPHRDVEKTATAERGANGHRRS